MRKDDVLDCLSPRERRIWDERERVVQLLAEEFRISRRQVRQIEDHAVEKLCEAMKYPDGDA